MPNNREKVTKWQMIPLITDGRYIENTRNYSTYLKYSILAYYVQNRVVKNREIMFKFQGDYRRRSGKDDQTHDQ